jgi:hypothetical protein
VYAYLLVCEYMCVYMHGREGGGGMRMRMYWCVNKYACVYM